LDALAGTGVRGVRVANEVEVGPQVQLKEVINDRSTPAYELVNRNIALNEVEEKARACNEDANLLLLRNRYDLVDLDPFGSPVPFLDAACKSVRRLLLVTATDTAPLCGAHTGGLRKYDAKPLNTEYHREMATRVLLGRVARDLCKYDKAVRPLLCYSAAHFVRILAGVEKGAKRADESLKELGFVAHCFSCGNRFAFPYTDSEILSVGERCEVCGSKTKIRLAGPLFIGPIKDKRFCERVWAELEERELGKKREALKIVGRCVNELDIPFFFEYHAICKSLKAPPPPISWLIQALRSDGFSASRTHFSETAVKTDARIDEIKRILLKSFLYDTADF